MPKQSGVSAPKRTALVLTPEAPYPAVGGGALRTASLLEYLGPRYATDVIAFHEPSAPDPRSFFPPGLARSVEILELPPHSKAAPARAARNLRRTLLGRPPLNDRFGGFEKKLAALLDGRRYDLAFVEHFWCAPYWDQIAPVAERTILDLHNIESVLHRRAAQAGPWPVSLLFRRFSKALVQMERTWIPRYTSVLATSQDDAAFVRTLAPQACVDIYPNAIPSVPLPAVAEEPVVLFSGNLEYQPNISAIRFFCDKIWPHLRGKWPDLQWRIAGKNAHAIARYVDGDRRIQISGPMENAVATIAAARVVVVPVIAASGTRIKILESWAAGRAVVSTPVGAEGLAARDGEHLFLAETPKSFVDAVSALLEAPALRARLGAAGRALYEERFTWEQAWKHLAALEI